MTSSSARPSVQAKETGLFTIRIPGTLVSPLIATTDSSSISSLDISACESAFASASSSFSSLVSSLSSPSSFKNTSSQMDSSKPPSSSKSSSKPQQTQQQHQQQSKKIPRPPNSFLIYRKEHATQYAGLVATELSSKLALSWKRETPERREHYAQLAVKAKQEHAIRYPNYKFTPVKRGTGKRALALEAMANAARKAAATSTSTDPVRSTAASVRGIAAHSPPSSTATTSANRPKRRVQRPQRYTTSAPYISRSTASKGKSSSRVAVKQEEQVESASLYFASYDQASWATPTSVQSSLSVSRTPYSTSRSPSTSSSPSLSDSDDESMDLDCVKEEDSDDETLKIHLRLDQLRCQEPYRSPAETISHQQQQQQQQQQSCSLEDHSILAPVTFPAYLSMEPFEPECLPRFETQWATTSSPYSVPSIVSSSSYNGYSTPVYEEMSVPSDPTLHFGLEMDPAHMPLSLAVTSSPFAFNPATSLAPSPPWSFLTPLPTPALCREARADTSFPFGGVQMPSPPNSSSSGASSLCSSPYSSPLSQPSLLPERKLELWL
ncbi:hypothetical protein EMPS_03295 [Entomortierella parvispora]|uniref:HMG box domain-containing protein n=1 Tax=Entomortierella parvispora TaxID=205924 RepID=A0A9P3LUR5_9FUNG|nr:hypothetical protein EMPS_03295 [Entomortierella parvispora]